MIAVIGTAGRDKSKPMTAPLWVAMVNDATSRIPEGSELVSGGAAWADHLAVELFLLGHAKRLRLHLPAPFATCDAFAGGYGTAGGAANFYHQAFSKATGKKTIREIATACHKGAEFTMQPEAPGMSAFFARNAVVAAEASACFAYTWGEGSEPSDGGTKNTWGQIKGTRVHVSLGALA